MTSVTNQNAGFIRAVTDLTMFSRQFGIPVTSFFYTVGNRLAQKKTGSYNDANGIDLIQKYAHIYGLDQKTGLEISESKSSVATEYPVMAAIGQSDNNYTTVALSRYVTAVASGKKYNYQLMNKIVDADGKTVKKYKADYEDISDTLTSSQWDAIHSGMREVVSTIIASRDLIFRLQERPVRHSRLDMPTTDCLLVMHHMMIRKLPSQ